MPLEDMTLKTGSTVGFTGGTADPLLNAGGDQRSKKLVFSNDSPGALQRSIDVSVKPSKAQSGAPGGRTLNRATYYYKYPLTLASGEITVETISVQFSLSDESDSTRRRAMRDETAQMICDAEADDLLERMIPV
jgi:hypothetical protein